MNRLIFLFILFAVSCNSQSDTKNSSGPNSTDSNTVNESNEAMAPNISGCYAYHVKQDSAFLKLDISGTKVTGTLSYYLYEKDSNSGSINGTLQDSLIVAHYTFQSEGMTSVRQVVFKMNNDTLIEGYGDIMMKGDTSLFKNISLLKFQNNRPLIKTACK